jgi:GNAT superfamily N-acetyltransferase
MGTGSHAELMGRQATLDDVALLARMNRGLIDDERARNPMNLAQLEERMCGWLERGEYRGELFYREGEPVAYALYQLRQDEYYREHVEVYLRQFYVERAFRRQGVGRAAIDLLSRTRLPAGCAVSIDVLTTNSRGYAFWSSVGFRAQQTRMHANQSSLCESD